MIRRDVGRDGVSSTGSAKGNHPKFRVQVAKPKVRAACLLRGRVGGAKVGSRWRCSVLSSLGRELCANERRERVSEIAREMGGESGATNFVWLQSCSPVCERKDAAVFARLKRWSVRGHGSLERWRVRGVRELMAIWGSAIMRAFFEKWLVPRRISRT